MRDELQYAARRIFAEFVAGFERKEGQQGWIVQVTPERRERMGLSASQAAGALTLLTNEGLIERYGRGHRLTDAGYRACVHRELIDEVLGSPLARGVGLQVIAQQVIVGNNNTLQVNSDEVNSDEVISKLVAHIAADTAIAPEKKKRWLEVLKDVGGHVAAEGLKIVIDKAIGK